jgi:pimeloyl-ACP methyl ester carboxylesterase
VIGGGGAAVLLLHGYPQSHVTWHQVGPVLAEHFTVIAADLPGYGNSRVLDAGPWHKRGFGRQETGCAIVTIKWEAGAQQPASCNRRRSGWSR